MICDVCGENVPVVAGRLGLHGPGGGCSGSITFTDKQGLHTEDRYTEPSEWCPHPERWHSADWDSAELEVTDLVAAFVGALHPDVAVETGSAWGQTAVAIGKALGSGHHDYTGKLYTVEIDPDRADCVRTEIKDRNLPVEVVCQDSMSWLPPPGVGFAWFDSLPHLRVPEFRRYHPMMVPGAIVGFHDTAPHFPLWPEIEKLEEEGLLLPIRLRTPRGVVFGEVV